MEAAWVGSGPDKGEEDLSEPREDPNNKLQNHVNDGDGDDDDDDDDDDLMVSPAWLGPNPDDDDEANLSEEQLKDDPNTKVYTIDQVSKHNSENSCWIVLGRSIYDVTKWMKKHPEGPEILLDVAGTRADDDYDEIVYSKDALEELKQHEIGRLKQDGQDDDDEEQDPIDIEDPSGLPELWRNALKPLEKDGVKYDDSLWEGVLQACREDESFDDFSIAKNGPVMSIFRKMPPLNVVQLILEEWPAVLPAGELPFGTAAVFSPTLSTDTYDENKTDFADDDGKTILHHAAENGASIEVIQAIVEKDAASVFITDNMERYPICMACLCASKYGLSDNSQKTISFLMDKGLPYVDPILETILFSGVTDEVLLFIMKNGDSKTIGRKRQPVTHLLPIHIAIAKMRSGAVVAPLIRGDRLRLHGFTPSLVTSLAKITAKSQELQEIVNHACYRRWPTSVLFFKAYCNIVWLIIFVDAAARYLSDSQHLPMLHVFLYVIAVLSVLEETYQIRHHGLFNHIKDFWNMLDIVRIVLVIASTASMGTTTGGTSVSEPVRHLLLVTGASLVGGLVVFLRATFLPFATFVGGLVTIMKTLVPFIIVSTLIVFAFGFMYFTLSFDSTNCEGFCSLDDAVLTTFYYFFNGGDETDSWWLDLIFGLVVVVVLLNVVIAIVSDAWADGKKAVDPVFWEYRIAFLAEAESLEAVKHLPISNFILFCIRCLMRCKWETVSAKLWAEMKSFDKDLSDYESKPSTAREDKPPETFRAEDEFVTSKKLSYDAKEKFAVKLRDFDERLARIEREGNDRNPLRSKLDTLENLFYEKTGKQHYWYLFHEVRRSGRKRRLLLFRWIDEIGELPVWDQVNWYDEPFNAGYWNASTYYALVSGRTIRDMDGDLWSEDNYWWVTEEQYQKLLKCGSFQKNWIWSCEHYWNEDRDEYADEYIKKPRTVAFEFFVYLLMLVLGVFTFGLFWPTRIRRALLSFSTQGKLETVQDVLKKKEAELSGKPTPKRERQDPHNHHHHGHGPNTDPEKTQDNTKQEQDAKRALLDEVSPKVDNVVTDEAKSADRTIEVGGDTARELPRREEPIAPDTTGTDPDGGDQQQQHQQQQQQLPQRGREGSASETKLEGLKDRVRSAKMKVVDAHLALAPEQRGGQLQVQELEARLGDLENEIRLVSSQFESVALNLNLKLDAILEVVADA